MAPHRVTIAPRFESWQEAARALLRAGVRPDDVVWTEETDGAAPAADAPRPDGPASAVRVPRHFLELARRAAAGREPTRWALLYRVLWRVVHEGRELLDRAEDPDTARLRRLAPDAPPADAGAPPGAGAFLPPGADEVDRAGDPVDLETLRRAAATCAGCALHRDATQTVFGRGPARARVVLVGEQPGDQEDRQGAPFVGPAGEVLDRALREAGLSRDALYVTNAVKHFKFVRRGPRRIHQKPGLAEVRACRPWLEAELAAIRPEIVVCLGATAATALLGSEFRLMRERGRFVAAPLGPRVLATLHPSAVLRGEDEATQARLYGLLVGDLRTVAAALAGAGAPSSRAG